MSQKGVSGGMPALDDLWPLGRLSTRDTISMDTHGEERRWAESCNL